MGICEGRVVAITGAGRGLGRAYALAFARAGASVVVNDLGVGVDGSGGGARVADEVVAEIESEGGSAVADSSDVATTDGAAALVGTAVQSYGRLDVVVCNAGTYAVDWLWDTSVETWDSLMRVHLRGLFCPADAAVQHWRARSGAGEPVDGRLICITSQSGLFAAPASAAYDTAKAGVAGFVLVAADELARFGVTVNGVAPRATTRMTRLALERRSQLEVSGAVDGGAVAPSREPVPEDVAPFLVWLGSMESREVTGRIFTVTANRITLIRPWSNGPSAHSDKPLAPADVGDAVRGLLGSDTRA